MSSYKSPTETLKRINRRLEAGDFMLNDDIEWLISEFDKYEKAIKTVLEAEPQGEEDEETLLTSLKSYLQGLLEGRF